MVKNNSNQITHSNPELNEHSPSNNDNSIIDVATSILSLRDEENMFKPKFSSTSNVITTAENANNKTQNNNNKKKDISTPSVRFKDKDVALSSNDDSIDSQGKYWIHTSIIFDCINRYTLVFTHHLSIWTYIIFVLR